MKNKIYTFSLRLHVVLLPIAILNAIIKSYTLYSLSHVIEIFVEWGMLASGLILFILLVTKRKFNLYFSVYGLAASLVLIGLAFRGLIFGVILMFICQPFMPDEVKFEDNGIRVCAPPQGFMAPCCAYLVKERKFYVFEKSYPEFNLEGSIDFNTMKLSNQSSRIELTYTIKNKPHEVLTHSLYK